MTFESFAASRLLKPAAIAFGLALAVPAATAQITVFTENLESEGFGTRYFANQFGSDAVTDFNHRTSLVNGTQTETNVADPSYIPNAGSWFWNMRDLDGAVGGNPSLFRFVNHDISAYEKLTVSIDIALGSFFDAYDGPLSIAQPPDTFTLRYSFDNSVDIFSTTMNDLILDDASNFQTLAAFEGSGAAMGSATGIGIVGVAGTAAEGESIFVGNVSLDGSPGLLDPTKVQDIPFHTFTFDLDLTLGLYNDVAFEILTSLNGGGEVLAWDNFKVVGYEPIVVVPVPEPSTYGIIGALALAGLIVRRRFRR